MKVACIVHGRKKPATLLNALMHEEGLRFEVFATKEGSHAIQLTRQAIESGFERIIAVGGDGTLHEVINGVLLSDRPGTPVLFYPWGTGNDWGRTISPPSDFDELRERLLSNNVKKVDAGEISYVNNHGQTEKRFFINIADAGMGASVVRKVNDRSKWLGPRLTFFRAIIETFLTFSNRTVKCLFDNQVYEGNIRSIVIANGKFFGSGLCIAPDAEPNDGIFSIVIIGNVNVIDYLRYVPLIRQGRRIEHPEIHYLSCTTVRINSPQKLEFEADGEFLGCAPVKCHILPESISLL